MIYLRGVRLEAEADRERYPLAAPALRDLEGLAFERPISLLAGDNGCGKTGLLLLLAQRLGAENIALYGERAEEELPERGVRLQMGLRPKRCFLLRSEDFLLYLRSMSRARQQARQDYARAEEEYRHRSALAREHALMPHAHTLGDLERLYANDLARRSHGEGYLDFFSSRLKPDGLYLLDEPEAALSPFNQLVLLHLLQDAAGQRCQFLVATHSPVLLACPDAAIYEMSEAGMQRRSYRELESVRFLKAFLADPERLLRS